MGLWQTIRAAFLGGGSAGGGGEGVSRRQFLVTVQGAAIGTFLLPDEATAAGGTAGGELPRRVILGRTNKIPHGDGFSLMWAEADAQGQARVWVWHPETPQEIRDARRFYDAARGVGPDAPEGRRIKRGKATARTEEERELLRAILAAPQRDRPYLNYADWLENRGDSYGTYLRLSSEVRKLSSGDPRWGELAGLQERLVIADGPKWLRPLADLGLEPRLMGHYDPMIWYDDRGVISKFTVDKPGVLPENVERFFAAVPLVRKLDLDDSDIDVAVALQLPQFAQIVTLNIRPTCDEAMLDALARSPNLGALRALDLYGGSEHVPTGAVERFAASALFARLTRLRFGHAQLGDDGVTALAQSDGCRGLTQLELPSNSVTGTGFVALCRTPHLKGLELLDLDGNEIHPETFPMFLPAAAFVPTLKEFRLNFCGLNGQSIAALAAAPFAKLEVLLMSFGDLSGAGMRALAGAAFLPGLRRLDIAHGQIGDAEAEALAGGRFARLEELKLDNNPFGDAGLAALSRGNPWPKLTKLSLLGTGVGVAGVTAFAQSERYPALSELDLRELTLGDAGCEALARSPSLRALTRLLVDEAKLGKRGKKALLARFGEEKVSFF